MRISLNLLPPQKKKALQNELILAHFQTIGLILFITVGFSLGILLVVRQQLAINYQDLKRRSVDSTSVETTATLDDIKQTNALLRRIDGIQKEYVPWSDVIEAVTAVMPPDIRIENLDIDQDGNIRLAGVAQTRDSALELLSRLKSAPFLTDVVSPLSNILQRENVNFNFSMKYKSLPNGGS